MGCFPADGSRIKRYNVCMKKIVCSIWLLCLPVVIFAAEVRHVTAETTRMTEDTLKKRFQLKPGDSFTEEIYQKAQEDLHKLRVFKTLEFLEEKHKDGVDIHIKADDRSYVFPMAFALSGKKRSAGVSLFSGNILKQGESAFIFVGGGRDGFATNGGIAVGDHAVFVGYSHLNFEQSFYENGWMSRPGVFSSADDKGKHNAALLGTVHGKQDDLLLSYRRKVARMWSVSLTPQYEYYEYEGGVLDSGNHSHVSVGVHYVDDIRPGMNMGALSGLGLSDKKQALRDLPRVRTGKLAEVIYTAGGTWTGSDYEIQKLSWNGTYLWELKDRHILTVFAKAQRAFKAPFSNQVESSDLLFGLGIYDREQRGKGGVSAGVSFTYFILRNQTGLLSLMPFYEQAYITSGGHSYQPHSGVGAMLSYRLWRFPLPVGVSFTQNINDGTHHVGFRIGGHF